MAMSKVQQVDTKEKLLTDIDDKVLLCSICMQRFKSPKILQCFHTFCEPCLTEWVKTCKGKLVCPTCKQSWPLTHKGVPGIANNGFMNDLLELMADVGLESKPSVCEGCDNTAKYWCKDCGQFFCDECVRTHKVVRSLKNHKLMTIEEYTAKKETKHFKLLQPRFCDDHPDSQLEFYCDSCQSPVCYKCTVVKHKSPSHDVIQMEDALKKYTPSIEAHIESLRTDVEKLKIAKEDAAEVAKSLEAERATAEMKIKERVKKICDAVRKEGDQLLNELGRTYVESDKQIVGHLEHLDLRLGNADSMHSYLSHVLRYGSGVDILTAKKATEDSHLHTKPVEDQIKAVYDLRCHLVFEESDHQITTNIGRVFKRMTGKKKDDKTRSGSTPAKRSKSRSDFLSGLVRDVSDMADRTGSPYIKYDKYAKCAICMDHMSKPKPLPCMHTFCKKCIDQAEQVSRPSCPICKVPFGIITGNMPEGTMTHTVGMSLFFFHGNGYIVITYYFPSGIQGNQHPNPGQPYTGTEYIAYLPNNTEGQEVLRLLEIAFDRKLTFTIGTSDGQPNTVIWNGIHHKTNAGGGPEKNGYPDQNYLRRVKKELAAKGVK